MTPQSMADQVYERLRDMLIDGSVPAGSQLPEAHLAESFGISRGPIREAMQRLATEGLVVSVRNHGVFALEFTEDDIRDLYYMRAIYEESAFLACRGDERVATALTKRVDELEDALAKDSWLAIANADIAFHLTAVESVGSPRLLAAYRQLSAQATVCVRQLQPDYPHPQDLVAEHRQLITLMGDADEAELRRGIQEHLTSAADSLVARLHAAHAAGDKPA